jgi:2,4-dienoyl-CoA reductase-like NADH-dependent reductase (Old Yellow Enzyme family)
VELHGAHGYLIDQFFWDGTNQRTDRYGGATLVQRSQFAAEILRAVRAAVGADYPVIIRLSQWKSQDFTVQLAKTPQEMEAWLRPLADAGADLFHCSQRRFWEPEFEGCDLNFAGWAKKLIGKPTITVGSVGLAANHPNQRRSTNCCAASTAATLIWSPWAAPCSTIRSGC